MSLFIELVTSPFTPHDRKAQMVSSRRAGNVSARRPQRGLEIREDTYAVLKVVGPNGKAIPLVSSSNRGGTTEEYTNFMLQRVSEARMEKQQILETFGEAYIFFFGEQPRFIDVQAVLVDSNDFNWYAEFWENYENYFRGTKLVEMGARVYLMYDDIVVEGYMVNAQAEKVSDTPLSANLNFRLFVTKYYSVSLTNDSKFPMHAGSTLNLSGLNVKPLPPLATDPALSASGMLAQSSTALGGYSAQLGVAKKIADYAGVGTLSNIFGQAQQGTKAVADFTGVVQNAVRAGEALFGKNPPSNATSFFRDPNVPIRSNIENNVDEYTDAYPISDPLGAKPERKKSWLEKAENLSLKSITLLKQSGAVVSNAPGLLKNLGIPGTGSSQPSAFSLASSPGSLTSGLPF